MMEKSDDMYDVIILGAGPAGLQAAIHAARRKTSVLVIGKTEKSSAYRAHIDNFCCLEGRSGEEMLNHAREKAEAAGAAFLNGDVTALDTDGTRYFINELEKDQALKSRTLVLAMGISRNTLGLEEEKEFLGRGLSYCVDCDGPLFKNQPVAVVGCGSAAVSGALTMMFYTTEIHLVCEQFEVGDHLVENLRKSDIIVHEGHKVTHIEGEGKVAGLRLDDETRLDIKGLFIEQGAKGAVDLAGGLGIALDDSMKYVAVNKKQETNLAGVYAAGDICGPPWQVAKSIGEGCVAGMEAAAYARKWENTG